MADAAISILDSFFSMDLYSNQIPIKIPWGPYTGIVCKTA